MHKLPVRTRREDPAGHKVVCPHLPGCVGTGATLDEALENFCMVAEGYLASLTNFVVRPESKGLHIAPADLKIIRN